MEELHYSSEEDDKKRGGYVDDKNPGRFSYENIHHVDVYASEKNLSITIIFNGREYHKKHNILFDNAEEHLYYYEKIKKSINQLYSYPEKIVARPYYFYENRRKIESMSVEEMIEYIKNGSTHLSLVDEKYFFDHNILKLDHKKLYKVHAMYLETIEDGEIKLVPKFTRTSAVSGFHHMKSIDDKIVNTFLEKNKKSIVSYLAEEKIEFVQGITLYFYRIFEDLYSFDLTINHL